MKKLLALLFAACAGTALANDVYVQPHFDRNGNFVQGHYRSAPNSSRHDNYSTQGNYNPYTGHAGTRQPSYEIKPIEPIRQPRYETQPNYGYQPLPRQKRNPWD